MSILTILEKKKRNKSVSRAGAFALTILVLTFFIAFANSQECQPIQAFAIATCIITVGFTLATMAYFMFRYTFSEILSRTAHDIDTKFHDKNRLEAATELQATDNPLKNFQLKDTEEFFKEKNIGNLSWLMFIMIGLIFSMLYLNSYFLYLQFQVSSNAKSKQQIAISQKKEQIALNQKKKETKKAPEDFAKLVLTAPDSEMRAKPMDEITWDGVGEATKGFDQLFIALYLNGELKKKILIEKDDIKTLQKPKSESEKDENLEHVKKETKTLGAQKSDKVLLAGEFCLDDIDVVPFDLVSYHLLGFSDMNGNKKSKIISQTQFIEVRPFREDALIKKCECEGNSKLLDLVSLINKYLRFQITLNKAVFTVRSSGLSTKNKIFKEQINMLVDDQRELKEQLDKTLQSPPEKISANMMSNLRMASNEMEKAEKNLEKLK